MINMCLINYLIFILIFFCTINFQQVILTQNICKNHEFHCDNGDCVNKTLICNDVNDCADGSDELHCDCREPEFFLCKNSICISHTFVCDNENDCGDYSDEEDCKDFKMKFSSNYTCDKDHWQCLDKLCISSDFVCNGEVDCLDGSDETIGCTLNITCDGFKCKNGHCTVQEWRCDGNDDCGDNSDEENCEYLTNVKDCSLDGKTFLCKDNKTCIQLSNVCDGKQQCPDGSDESRNCQLPCSALNCPDKCIHLPTGPKCVCHNGYYYNEQDHSCDDINECDTYGICDQKCRNTAGSYECYCNDGFTLKSDKWSCKSNNNDSIMFFSTKSEIRAYMLEKEIYYPVATDLKQVVGVVYDGEHLYWTDIFSEHESIVRCLKDGSNRELIVTSGLGAPEDLDIDLITGNIYFTDAERQHIGVCNNNGTHCTILINKDIQKPRGIVLDPENGEMYWTDWGKHPEIAKSLMDGTKDISFVSNNIHWPNGLAIDYYNDRLYWTDAKIQTIESINLDGTDRRIILDGILKHPYSINIYEDRLYWSDWTTHSIHSCNKFTGKNHHTVIKEEKDFIYGIHIYHKNLYDKKLQKRSNPCTFSFCSDLCLLSGTSYTCTCPQDKELNMDGHTCKEINKKQNLILAAQNLIVRVEHQLLGKHQVQALPIIVRNVGALAYNSINNTLYISDIDIRKIISVNLHNGDFEELPIDDDGDELGSVTAMDYDVAGNNLYWCDTEKRTVELFNLNTMSKKILLHDFSGEIPESITLVSEIGVMFIAFKKSNKRESHIDRFYMDGTHRTHVIETGLLGPIHLLYDQDTHRVFFSDVSTGNIETTSVDGDDRHGFRSLQTSPICMAALKTDLFWVNQYSHRLYWANKFNNDNGYNKKIALDLPDVIDRLQIVSILPKTINDNPCHHDNGGCSHICLSIGKHLKCDCPTGMILGGKNNKTCTKLERCELNEFYCGKSNQCILHELRCNGRNDCKFNEDEENCQQIVDCGDQAFKCTNGDCIDSTLRCNHHYDCQDKSDEYDCNYLDTTNNCPPHHFRCNNGYCLSQAFVCDNVHDCVGGEDEVNCEENVCNSQQFRCTTGACIPKSWECDHEYDCPDYSDEHTNCTQCSSPGLFKCKNGKCIDKSFVCDNENDCGDHSDESDCDDEINQYNCPSDMFQCKSNKSLCIPLTAICNKTSECPHREDEQGCSDCHIEEFTCNNKKCIPTQWLCDHTNDCGDNSDEEPTLCVHSTNLKNVQHLVPCDNHNSYRCKNGLCIDLMSVCNGESDCYDDSDEDGACTTSCQVDSNPCSQECHRTPNGPLCKCRQGYELLNDGYSCEDINECLKQPPVCSQICNNQIGSYFCDCYNGFILRSDKKSCKAEGAPMSLIFTVDNQIRELSQIENSLKLLYQEDIPKISGLDVIVNNHTIYFTIEETGTIHFINYITKQRQYMKNIGQPTKLTIDWLTNNIYFINNDIDRKSISICNFNEHKCSQFLTIDLHRQVTSITIDPINKILFYSLVNWRMFNSPNYMIYKINLDGNNLRVLINTTTGYISGLTYDYNKKHLYYLDQHLGILKRINYDGTMDVLIKSNLTRPIGLDFYENHIYISSTGGYIIKCKLYDIDTTYLCDNFRVNSLTTDLFVIVQQSKQPLIKNQCNNHNCQHLCLPTNHHYKCLCDHGKIINSNDTCETIIETRESTNDDDHRPLLQIYKPLIKKPLTDEEIQQQQHAHSVVSKIASIAIPLGLICLIASAYYFYKKHYKLSKTTDFNTISFHNSGYGLHYNDDDEDIVNKKIVKNQSDKQPKRHEFVNPIVLCDDHDDGNGGNDHQSRNIERSNLLVDV